MQMQRLTLLMTILVVGCGTRTDGLGRAPAVDPDRRPEPGPQASVPGADGEPSAVKPDAGPVLPVPESASLPDAVAVEEPGSSPSDASSATVDAGAAPLVIVRAKEIEADSVRARVIYAKDIWAGSGQIQARHENADEGGWEGPAAAGKITRAELVADVIYVKELRCNRIDAVQAFAKSIHLGETPR